MYNFGVCGYEISYSPKGTGRAAGFPGEFVYPICCQEFGTSESTLPFKASTEDIEASEAADFASRSVEDTVQSSRILEPPPLARTASHASTFTSVLLYYDRTQLQVAWGCLSNGTIKTGAIRLGALSSVG